VSRIPLTDARNLGARPELFRLLRADVTDYGRPGIQLRPARRRKRGILTPEDVAENVVQIPTAPGGRITSRIWPFHMETTTAPNRTTGISGAFSAPAMIYAMAIQYGNPTGVAGLGLWWDTNNAGRQVNGAEGTIPSGTPIFEPITFEDANSVDNLSERNHVAEISDAVATRNPEPLRYIVRHFGQFFLKLSLATTAGSAAISCRGHVIVLEAESFEVLEQVF